MPASPPNLADGQVAITTAAAILSSLGGPVSITFTNVGGSTETLVVTMLRAGGTARRIARVVLAANEQFVIAGLPVNAADTIKAIGTNAASIDYVVHTAPDGADLQIYALDSSGGRKAGNSGIAGTLTIVTENDTAGASTAAAGTTTADAGALPAGTAKVYPTTAADGTKGVRVNASDKVTSRIIMIGNGVSNAILKVYAPSGGTINGAAADAAFSSVSGKGVIMYCLDATANTWLAW